MRIITCNTNGIRAAQRKGFFEWLSQQDADVVCIQETKAQESQLSDEVFHPAGYHCYYYDAVKKGYSGTALYCKQEPKAVTRGLGFDVCDTEGRWIKADFEHVSVVSLYLPSGSSGEEKQQRKFEFMEQVLPLFQSFEKTAKAGGLEVVIAADWNICHQEIDLKNFKGNRKNSGFLPEERQWMDDLLNKEGFTDSYRSLYPDTHQYTWWSNRGQAYANDVGWRLDYLLVTSGLKNKATAASVYKDEKFSDHAPLIIDFDTEL
ncbi:MAG: exodeoxyribonuclease III [Pseudomonadales bacterium]|nr:exodeoxyribonuclease III [Pseudomonadales bacterium]